MNNAVLLKNHNKYYKKQILWLIGIALGSIILMLCMTNFSSEIFLYDDNRNQWMPIMDKAYEQFFSTGVMPNYDFFQCKGLEIADQGYYCLNNPIMIFSYILYSFVFMKSWGSTISFYILIMFILGNITAFLICRELEVNKFKALLVVLIYSSCSAFYMVGYWYYIFNNYFIVPLILYAIIKLKDSKLSYIAGGIILALDLLLGNVQYTIYHYCLYAIIMLGMGIFSKRKNFLKMLTNCMTGILLTVPQLILLMQASLRSATYSTNSNNIFNNSISLEGLVLGIFVPGRLFGADNNIFLKIFNCLIGRNETMILYAGGFALCLYGLIFVIIHSFIKKFNLWKIKTNSEFKSILKDLFYQSELRAFYIGIFVSMLFFALYFTANITAHILSVVPIFKNLRFVFKAYFVFLPVCIVPTAVFIKKMKSKKYGKIIYIICSVLTLIGFVNSYFVEKDSYNSFGMYITGRYEDETAILDKELDKVGFNRNNYRVCAFNSGKSDFSEFFNAINKIQRNVSTTVGVFTLGGYEQTALTKSVDQSCYLMVGEEALYGNASYDYIFEDDDKDNIMPKIEEQLINNSVKYIIIDDEKDKIDIVADSINYMKNIKIKRSFKFMQGCIMIELDGIPALCTDNKENDIKLDTQMNKLSFEIYENSDIYRLAFTYKDNIRADYVSSDGSIKKQLETAEDADGYLLVKTNGLSNGTVKITYTNTWIIIGNISSIIISILFLGLMIFLVIKKQ